eukprot:TRINITY_DN1643_c0_g1_i1.p2 TRINITY_DN1643_c0_g1~~TRINITY_DN1643_c0_g1_i1.p2  ORF type:complete len:183 (-),score=41.87 TRINITY_DN1643_c0_g1_i1:159-707(-)
MSFREEMVARAVKFLLHPKVVDAPLSKKISFLEEKELTREEIDEALKRAESPESVGAAASTSKARAQRETIQRFEHAGVQGVITGGVLHLSAVAAKDLGADAAGQARQVLEQIDAVLQAKGASRSRIISATVFLRNAQTDGGAVAAEWELWLGGENHPAFACVEAGTAVPAQLVTIQVTAAM